MKYKAVVFDLDGTLLDTLQDLTDAANATLAHFQFPPRSREEIRSFVGNGVAQLVRLAIPEGEKFEHFEEAVQFHREYYNANSVVMTRPYEGVIELLSDLKDRGIKLAIVSNKPQPTVTQLNEIFFKDYINVAVGETKDIKHKPAADTVLMAMKQLEVEKKDCVYVGDTEVDVLTAENTGIDCICVDWGFRDRDVLVEAGARLICSDAEELLHALELSS